MFARSLSELEPVKRSGGIRLIDDQGKDCQVNGIKVARKVAEAISEADVIIVVVPSTGHLTIAENIGRQLRDGQIILLNPGHTGGALEFKQKLIETGCKAQTTLCETMTLTYLSRLRSRGTVKIFKKSKNILYAALPGSALTRDIRKRLEDMFKGLVPVENVLVTGLANVNAMMHPPGMIMNAGWIEHTWGGFRFYTEGITQSIARVIERMDGERMSIMKGLGLDPVPFGQVFHSIGSSTIGTGSIFEIIQHSEPNKEIRAPESLNNRYVHEDVGHGLVPMMEFAKIVGVDAPVMNYLTEIASIINGTNYKATGRTAAKLGISGMDKTELLDFVSNRSD
jgi:opine dehydrogenase